MTRALTIHSHGSSIRIRMGALFAFAWELYPNGSSIRIEAPFAVIDSHESSIRIRMGALFAWKLHSQ
jgi:hypothetical protein